MASRTKQKEEARARRLAAERAEAERKRKQRRIQTTLGIVLAAVAVIAVAIVVSTSGGSSSGGIQKGAKLAATQSAVSELLTGVRQSGPVLGNPKAPVTMTYYGDLQCPVCKAFTLQGGWSQLVQNEVKNGKVRVQFKAFQTATRDPSTFVTQQSAALAAGKQDKFWNFMELFYRQQGQEGTNYANEAYLDGLARQIPGLNLSTWRTDRSDSALASQVQSEIQQGKSIGVSGTPTLVFQGPKGQTALSGVPSYSELQKSIQSVA
jgi:protein-disulfide isomerase